MMRFPKIRKVEGIIINTMERLHCFGMLPLNQRETLYGMAEALDKPKKLQMMSKGGKLRANYSTVDPTQNEDNMRQHINFCIDHININHQRFEDMMEVVYLGENWFYLTLKKHKYY